MSKAEERYLDYCLDGRLRNCGKKDAFLLGYHQAEKDLELGWKDMSEIVKIANLLEIEWLNSTPWDGIRDCGFYQEVLKRYKDFKERKVEEV